MKKVFIIIGIIFVTVVFASVHTQAGKRVKIEVGVDCLSYLGPNADLTGANLTHGNLQSALFGRANCTGADFTGANLIGASMGDSILVNANLTGVDLTDAVIWQNVDLTNPDLHFTNLSQVDLRGADLTGANLWHANMQGANLTSADLTGANLNDVIWNGTTCPDGINSDGHGNTCEGHLSLP